MRIDEPMKQILKETQHLWDHDRTSPHARKNFKKMIECGTPALGWRIYASETEQKLVYHRCKVRSCPSCGYRATLQWQREQWTELPDVPYVGALFTLPNPLWSIFKQNRHLLHDLPTIGAEAIMLWMKEKYGVCPLVLVVQHTFGRHLDFKPHLHVLISAGGLSESEGRWHGRLSLNPVAFMKLWRYGVIRYLRSALKAGILKSDLKDWELKQLFVTQYERDWYVGVQEHITKKYFLGYAARYIRRLPIAQRRIREIIGDFVKFETTDTKTKELVLDEMPKQRFIETLADHIPDHYRHAIRYYGLLSPRVKSQFFAVLFAFLGQKRQQRPGRLSWAEMIRRYFDRDPLVDSRGKPLEYMGRVFPAFA